MSLAFKCIRAKFLHVLLKGSKFMNKVIIIEDDILLNNTLTYNLVSDGYRVDSAYSCIQARAMFTKEPFDLALLDINLPDGNGLQLCGELKKQNPNTYVIFLTANDKESDMLKGYEAGGADYITKPFSIAVLSKKVAAIFENMNRHSSKHEIYEDEFLKIDFSEQSATLAGAPIEFTPKEYRTIYLFVKNSRILLTKRQLLEKLWDVDGDFVDEHTLVTIISRIRKKIETDEHKYIKTSYGMGYQWIGGADR